MKTQKVVRNSKAIIYYRNKERNLIVSYDKAIEDQHDAWINTIPGTEESLAALQRYKESNEEILG